MTDHPSIIKLKLFLNALNIGVIEFAHNGNLNDFLIQRDQPLGMLISLLSNQSSAWNQRLLWVFQLVEGIEYLHSKGIIHRTCFIFALKLIGDLRCANILVVITIHKLILYR